jgi:hypothetical protein
MKKIIVAILISAACSHAQTITKENGRSFLDFPNPQAISSSIGTLIVSRVEIESVSPPLVEGEKWKVDLSAQFDTERKLDDENTATFSGRLIIRLAFDRPYEKGDPTANISASVVAKALQQFGALSASKELGK